jgi:hypothetical protein
MEATKCAILIKIMANSEQNFLSIPVKNYSDNCVKNALAEYTGLDASKFQCLASSMSYGIYGLKDKVKGFPIRKWTAPSNTDYAYTFRVRYIRTL